MLLELQTIKPQLRIPSKCFVVVVVVALMNSIRLIQESSKIPREDSGRKHSRGASISNIRASAIEHALRISTLTRVAIWLAVDAIALLRAKEKSTKRPPSKPAQEEILTKLAKLPYQDLAPEKAAVVHAQVADVAAKLARLSPMASQVEKRKKLRKASLLGKKVSEGDELEVQSTSSPPTANVSFSLTPGEGANMP
ncbi:uncharacterized protein A4U43_C04F21900 [Asparagus officinalis]|uniref:Uncharacterized protein n=1 Tax=Asparagus officinalis TaxID=4686 RepID=A0A5P1F3E5_ASPOF|nr:uncharacterized protein A4U43_C04F21900 [Asparagus officinalis]